MLNILSFLHESDDASHYTHKQLKTDTRVIILFFIYKLVANSFSRDYTLSQIHVECIDTRMGWRSDDVSYKVGS